MSPDRLQSVEPACSDSRVDPAPVVVLAKKSWTCDAPGWPGWTMGSSGSLWLYLQALTKFPVRAGSARAPAGAAKASAGAAKASAGAPKASGGVATSRVPTRAKARVTAVVAKRAGWRIGSPLTACPEGAAPM